MFKDWIYNKKKFLHFYILLNYENLIILIYIITHIAEIKKKILSLITIVHVAFNPPFPSDSYQWGEDSHLHLYL